MPAVTVTPGPPPLVVPAGTVRFRACGLVAFSGRGSFATREAGGGCSLFFDQHSLTNAFNGALVVVYDVNFAVGTSPADGGANEDPFRLNMEAFVASPQVAPEAVPTLTGWGLILLALAFAAIGFVVIHRRVSA